MRALGLAFVLSGCLPVAMLRPPEPARGAGFSLGATLMTNPFGGRSPALLLPYLAYQLSGVSTVGRGSGRWGFSEGLIRGCSSASPPPGGLEPPPKRL